MEPGAARVRVPCSTSNLGAGFDCIGLALDRYLEASFEPGGTELVLERSGTLASLSAGPDRDPLVAALRERLGRRGLELRGRLRVDSAIPVARGLGSSAAAGLAGQALGAIALGERFSPDEAWIRVAAAEGHPDNAAPCAFGGLIAVVPPVPGPHAKGRQPVRLPLSDTIGWAFAAPATEVPTERARRVLPSRIERETAVDSIRRMPALLRGLETGDAELIATGFADTLHVPHRLPLIPGGDDAMRAALAAGAWAVTISGSGSGLIAAVTRGEEAGVAEAMTLAFRSTARAHGGDVEGIVGFAVSADHEGTRVLAP